MSLVPYFQFSSCLTVLTPCPPPPLLLFHRVRTVLQILESCGNANSWCDKIFLMISANDYYTVKNFGHIRYLVGIVNLCVTLALRTADAKLGTKASSHE